MQGRHLKRVPVFFFAVASRQASSHLMRRRPDSAGHTTAGIPHVLYSRSCLTGSRRRKSCHTLPVLQCAAQICRLSTACALFYLHGLFVRRRKPLTAKITQPYPAGALRPASSAAADYAVTSKAAKAAVFIRLHLRQQITPRQASSPANAVWQLHFSSAAGVTNNGGVGGGHNEYNKPRNHTSQICRF